MDTMHDVKEMYDGFIFGKQKDMYNPWSICNYMRSGELQSYWINTSSNKLIGEIIRRHPVRSKHEIEQLMAGESFIKRSMKLSRFNILTVTRTVYGHFFWQLAILKRKML